MPIIAVGLIRKRKESADSVAASATGGVADNDNGLLTIFDNKLTDVVYGLLANKKRAHVSTAKRAPFLILLTGT